MATLRERLLVVEEELLELAEAANIADLADADQGLAAAAWIARVVRYDVDANTPPDPE